MKAEINTKGVLILSAETETESFAIDCWLKMDKEKQDIIKGFGSIPYNIPELKTNQNNDYPPF